MEQPDEDPEPLERQVDNLFAKSDEIVFAIFNRIMEAVNELYDTN